MVVPWLCKLLTLERSPECQAAAVQAYPYLEPEPNPSPYPYP